MMNRTAKTVAMLSLSACVLVGSAVCSFAAEPSNCDGPHHQQLL